MQDWLKNEIKKDQKELDRTKQRIVKEIINIINKHSDSKIIIFSSFRVFIDLIKAYIPNCYTLESKYSMEKRNEILFIKSGI
jgi:ERCC4-related helicase